MSFLRRVIKSGIWILGAGLLGFAMPLAAQTGATDQAVSDLSPNKISFDQAPVLDGVLDEPIWARSALTDSFVQINPVAGAVPSERTEVRMAYTRTHLYIGVTLYDREPELITDLIMTRDTDVDKDDYFELLIDSYDTGRDSYLFMVSPTGARRDALTENNRKESEQWDTIWNARTQITDKGWSAEIAIPFRSFSFDPNIDSWGLQMRRRIQRKNEDIAWVLTDPSFATFNITDMGRLSGITDTARGRGLEVQGLVTSNTAYDWDKGKSKTVIDPSLNAYYRFTPSLTGTLTLNTDFSDTPLDPRQVNTDRFSLFFPETRDFFLQDQNLFAFGGRGFRDVNGLPFFSRRIGIVGGLPVDIDAGAKLSGSVGGLNIAALTTRTEDSSSLEAQTLSVARGSYDLGSGTRLGAILTHGDPTGQTDSVTGGFDVQYRSTELIEGQTVQADAFYLRSDNDGADAQSDGESYGIELAYPNDIVNGYFRYKYIDEDYAPALGFVNRSGIQDYTGQLRLRNRYEGGNVRYDTAGLLLDFTTDLDGAVESEGHAAYIQRVWQNGAQAFVFGLHNREVLSDTFNLPGGASVPAGDYNWQRGDVWLISPQDNNWNGSVEVICCDWYDGTRLQMDTSVEYRPSKYLNLKADYSYNDISVSGGDVDIHVFSGDVIVNITPDMQIENQLQYDNISEGLGYFGRFRWALRAETELLVTLSHGADTDFETFRATQSGLSVRLANSYRF